jgi:hypothetical protein
LAEPLFQFAISGIYSLLLLSLTFNFLLSIRLHLIDRRVEDIDKRSLREVEKMEERLKMVKAELVERKGYLL